MDKPQMNPDALLSMSNAEHIAMSEPLEIPQTTKRELPAHALVRKIKDHISACPNMEDKVIIFHSEAYAIIEQALDEARGRGYESGVEHQKKQ